MQSKQKSSIDPEQRQLIENAQRRTRQKRRLFHHFVFFLAGAVVLIIINVVLDYGTEFQPFNTPWFVWAILLWFFIFLVHVFNVFVTNKLLSKEWEEKQMERLVVKQRERIAELQTRVEKEHPLPAEGDRITPKEPLDPNKPINT